MIYFSLLYIIAIHNPHFITKNVSDVIHYQTYTPFWIPTVLPTRKNVSYVIHFERLIATLYTFGLEICNFLYFWGGIQKTDIIFSP